MSTIVYAGIGLIDASAPPQVDVALCVEQNRVVAVGTHAELRAQFPGAAEVGGSECLLLPAFVNSHDHGRGLGTAALGVPDDLLEIWLVGLWSQPVIDPYLAAALDGVLLLRSGVGTTAHSHNPRNWANQHAEAEATLRGYREAGIRVAFHPVMTDQNPLVYDDEAGFLRMLPPDAHALAQPFLAPRPISHAEYLRLCEELWQAHHDAEAHTAHIQISPAGGQWCSDDLIVAAVEFAQRHNTRVQMHMLETRYQRLYAQRRWGTSFIRHLEALGALGPWLTLAHMVWADPEDFALLAERGVGIAHNPSSNLRLRSGVAPLPDLLAAGVRVGIGLDGQGLDDDQDYLRELRLAWTLAKRPGAASPDVDARTIWRLGTSGGAAITLGADAPLGTLAPGQLADLVLLEVPFWLDDLNLDDDDWSSPLAMALQSASRRHVRDVMVNGAWVVRNGRCTTLDEDALAAEIRADLSRQSSSERRQAIAAARTLGPYLRRFYAQWEE